MLGNTRLVEESAQSESTLNMAYNSMLEIVFLRK